MEHHHGEHSHSSDVVVVDWRAVLMSLWEESLTAENRQGNLGSCNSRKEVRARIQKLHGAHKALKHADSGATGLMPAAALRSIDRAKLWFAAGEVVDEDTTETEETEANARHNTTLEFLLEGWGTGADGGGLHYASLLNYAAGVHVKSRREAVTTAIGAFAKNLATGSNGELVVDTAKLHLAKDTIRTVFPTARCLGAEANAVSNAMRTKSSVKLSVDDVLSVTSHSHSHIVPVLQPYVGDAETSATANSNDNDQPDQTTSTAVN